MLSNLFINNFYIRVSFIRDPGLMSVGHEASSSVQSAAQRVEISLLTVPLGDRLAARPPDTGIQQIFV